MYEIVLIFFKEIFVCDFYIWIGYDDEVDWVLNDIICYLYVNYKYIIGMLLVKLNEEWLKMYLILKLNYLNMK